MTGRSSLAPEVGGVTATSPVERSSKSYVDPKSNTRTGRLQRALRTVARSKSSVRIANRAAGWVRSHERGGCFLNRRHPWRREKGGRMRRTALLLLINARQAALNSRVHLVTAERDAYVAVFALRDAKGRAEARDLGLFGDALFDPTLDYARPRVEDIPAPSPLTGDRDPDSDAGVDRR